ncbi:MAG: ribonuclease P protein component [Gallionella sp.]|nr:ribonuclease P protein component [Gallionella sp.]
MQGAAYALACKPIKAFEFPRRYKLTRREGFSRILQQRAHTSNWFALHSQPNAESCARLGVSVSKRIVPSAVKRNSVKRLIRESFRLRTKSEVARDIVIRLRKPLGKQDRVLARAVLAEMLNKALTTQ